MDESCASAGAAPKSVTVLPPKGAPPPCLGSTIEGDRSTALSRGDARRRRCSPPPLRARRHARHRLRQRRPRRAGPRLAPGSGPTASWTRGRPRRGSLPELAAPGRCLDPGAAEAEQLDRRELAAGVPEVPSGLAIVELQGAGVYRYLVLTNRMAEVEATVLAAYRKRGGGAPARGLADLRGVVYARPLVEQYLAITGRTYFKGMAFEQARRLQFDLETTGLSPEQTPSSWSASRTRRLPRR